MNRHEADDSVNRLLDHIAAAFLRDDIDYARHLLAEGRTDWLREGSKQEQDEQSKRIQCELEEGRGASAWFETADGLRAKALITGERYFPPVWKRACRPSYNSLRELSSPIDAFTPIKIRFYEKQETAGDGRPIYRETP